MNNPVGNEQSLNQGLVDQFVEITSVDRDRARFYLETAGFDLALALSGYYEGGFEEEAAEEQPEIVYDRSSSSEDDEDEVQVIEPKTAKPQSSNTKNAANMSGKKPGQEKKKIASLFSGGASGGPPSSSDEDDDKSGQAFYVGGSEKSGQQVLGPPKKKGDNVVDKFFQQARERGAEQIDASQRAAAAQAGGSKSSFGGAGYRLGDNVRPAEKVGQQGADSDVQPVSVTVIMRMWRNGFTLDDGDLRTFDAPGDRTFLEHIMQGRLPPELIQTHRGKQIDLEMEDHRQEDYKPPKRAVKAFTGHGQMLGSIVPEVVGAGKVGEKSNAASVVNGEPAAAGVGQVPSPPVDESKPVTNIQVRLGNGERLVLKLNHDRSVKDVREIISQMRPDAANRPFILMTSFPSKELTNESMTLEEANLLNAVIIQRFK